MGPLEFYDCCVSYRLSLAFFLYCYSFFIFVCPFFGGFWSVSPGALWAHWGSAAFIFLLCCRASGGGLSILSALLNTGLFFFFFFFFCSAPRCWVCLGAVVAILRDRVRVCFLPCVPLIVFVYSILSKDLLSIPPFFCLYHQFWNRFFGLLYSSLLLAVYILY